MNKMNKIKLVVMIMGVLLLQSCTMYRIKSVTHPTGVTYHFPQKRILISEWEDIKVYDGDFSFKWARRVIDYDKNPNKVKIKYKRIK